MTNKELYKKWEVAAAKAKVMETKLIEGYSKDIVNILKDHTEPLYKVRDHKNEEYTFMKAHYAIDGISAFDWVYGEDGYREPLDEASLEHGSVSLSIKFDVETFYGEGETFVRKYPLGELVDKQRVIEIIKGGAELSGFAKTKELAIAKYKEFKIQWTEWKNKERLKETDKIISEVKSSLKD